MTIGANPFSWATTFPMARAGGMFIGIVGTGVFAGALLPARRRVLLVLGAASGTVALVLLARRLSSPFGVASRLQVAGLIGSIVLEALLIRVAVALYRNAGERALLLAILFAVGLHFIPMLTAFGPMCAALGVSLCICAGIGLWLRRELPLNRLWAIDGLLKMAFGAFMFFHP